MKAVALIPTDLAAIERLEHALLQMPQSDIVTTHMFYPGRYERTIIIPPWTVLSGAQHRCAYNVRLEKGVIAVNTDDGIKVLQAPFSFCAAAGVKRVGRVLEQEVVWVDIYDNPDNCQDIAALEERLYVIPEYGLGENRIATQIELDRTDYQAFLSQLGIDQRRLDQIVCNPMDLIPMPAGFDVEVRASKIHGLGLFALRHFQPDESICPGRLDGCRTPAGRYINHSFDPNTTSVKTGDDIYAVALRHIFPNEEIKISYRHAMQVNFGLYLAGDSPCQLG
jgi:hypothetical protein